MSRARFVADFAFFSGNEPLDIASVSQDQKYAHSRNPNYIGRREMHQDGVTRSK